VKRHRPVEKLIQILADTTSLERNIVSSAEHYGYDDFIPAEFLF